MSTPRCPHCGNAVRHEPARAVCVACGRGIDLVDATARELRLQGLIDRALRARSAEAASINESHVEEHAVAAGARARRGPVTVHGR
jgi:hypothetical protein